MLNATVSRDVLGVIVAVTTTFEGDELLQVESDGIEIHATDKSREAIVEVSASEAAFDSYFAKPMEIGISLEKVSEFLDLVDSTDLIRIEIDSEQGCVTLTAGPLTYTFSLVDLNDVTRVFEPLNAEQSAAVAILGRKLDVPIELANMAGSRIRLSVDSDSPTFSGSTNDRRDSLYFEFGASDVERICRTAVGPPVSLDYLVPIQRVIPSDALVRFELRNCGHVRLKYPIADGAGSVTASFAGLPV